ncbi:TPA: hypothetical protein OT945_003662 [Klebsiella pneumoniae]|uniref:hypothetical protein n=1 Tax=Bacteria TaxID=2 RepID=UPI00115B9DB5|nr:MULTISPECIES: hypothetical protein [Bacteria]HBW7357728.1 hypothetical protein [Klebsiella pneumoniae]HCB1287065.1 hypothetical protein [Klebsiella pneumoniae]HCQ7871329.1 hypothetical protein [Klebsiella pneumoniae]HCT8210376.1 hypothetical protein [Klebsiella pneumoniae]HCT8224443.1 hypothetical protein [Klebsiella pneumoniae]
MEVNGGEMKNTNVQVDGITYRNVVFINCTMIYSGSGGNMGFIDCTFQDCSWHFTGPAGNTIAFINDLVKAAGPNGKHLLDSLFGTNP